MPNDPSAPGNPGNPGVPGSPGTAYPTFPGLATAAELGRMFFAALEARDPHRLRSTLSPHASFRALPQAEAVRPADQIVAYFGAVVSSYPAAHWEVTDAFGEGDRAVIQFVIREFVPRLGRERISEQVALVRASAGKIVGIVGYYDSAEFHRLFWDEG